MEISRTRQGAAEGRHAHQYNGKSHVAAECGTTPFPSCSSSASASLVQQRRRWANMPPELLHDIIQRVEASVTSWPARRDVVACALVCRSWRKIAKEIVKTPEQCGCLTFPISLKQPGPRDAPIQCFIRRERATSSYNLYLGLSPAVSGDMSKLLLAARKIRRATSTDFVISLVADDFSRASNTCVGKLRSNFLGTKFTVYDSQPLQDTSIQSNCKSHRRIHPKQSSPRISVCNNSVATISYELNVFRARGPRRMQCAMHSIPISAIQEEGTAPTPMEFTNFHELIPNTSDPLVLKNEAPRWHERLQCWCLNFKGRVTVASVKNFLLVAAAEPYQYVSAAEQDKVILQFGKIGKDIFTMDYRYPLSAFQAFAICLSSFDTKPACE
ncbi:hypothetical protein FH972_018172 [Carpinus fangiana]|uniref:Tubby-like F-box protein n=1 Tax=Carpinus fangiana TaxID=176857 RepID=A0A5N6RP72_9ROSI|nr:hypothetical protein FH972_018172 [Carpinus fangiana]